jgi:hypothetical protein
MNIDDLNKQIIKNYHRLFDKSC